MTSSFFLPSIFLVLMSFLPKSDDHGYQIAFDIGNIKAHTQYMNPLRGCHYLRCARERCILRDLYRICNHITITFHHVLFAQIVAQERSKGSTLQGIYNDKRAVCFRPARAGCHQPELLLASEVRIFFIVSVQVDQNSSDISQRL